MKRLWDTIAGLRLGFEEHFRGAGSISLFVGLACNLAFVGQVYFWPVISLFVGLACNLAFVGQVYFWPSMWHTHGVYVLLY